MTTAREQAREAARKHVYDVMQHGGYTGPEPAADAASDVWEPLLREAYDLLGLYENQATPYVLRGMERIWKALN